MTTNSSYRDNYYGSILDPLHGDIKLSEIEKWCISQPVFSRLRKIKQNSFLYYVFPSAMHTRFEHSLGVMHLAGKIFDSCQENYATGLKKNQKYSEKLDSSFFDLNKLSDNIEIFYQELRLAALLHDIGHGPMSHLFDQFAIDKADFLEIVASTQFLSSYKTGFEYLIDKAKGKVEHEIISCAFIFYLIDFLKQTSKEDSHKFSLSANAIIQLISPERIISMLEPDFPGFSHNLIDENGNSYKHFFSNIVSAFPIDADRMDYLLRDSYFSGVTYGIYDINRIFASFQASLQKEEVFLTFKESGLDSMLRFIQSRSHLYNQVYFHKTNRAANTMLNYCTSTFSIKAKKLLRSKGNFSDFMNFYIQNSDEYFMESTLKNITETSKEEMILENLIERKLFKRVFQQKVVLIACRKGLKDEVISIVKVINEKLKELEEDDVIAMADFWVNETFKDANDKAINLAIKESGKKYSFRKDWHNASIEFELSDMIVCMVRIFLCRQFRSPAEYIQLSNKVRSHVQVEISKLIEIAKPQTE